MCSQKFDLHVRFIILLNAFPCVRVRARAVAYLSWNGLLSRGFIMNTPLALKCCFQKGIPVLAKLVVTWYTNTNLIILYLKTLVFCYFGIFLEERKLIHHFTTKWINFQGILKFFLPAAHIFARIDHSWQWKPATGRKVPPH